MLSIAIRLRLLQVAEGYVHLVTSINNADTLITLIVPSVMIIFSNVRISVALSQFSRDRHLILAPDRRAEHNTDNDHAAAAAVAATEGSNTSAHGRTLRYRTSLTLGRATSATEGTQVTAFGNGSFNQLQMKVSSIYTVFQN